VLHINSGRILSRESSTKGIFEYMDTQDVVETKRITKARKLERGQESKEDEYDPPSTP
jgi:hypothetical protein